MANIKKNATELIGGTPLMEVGNFSESEGVNQARILAKLEYLNPAGSVKDRVALAMIEDTDSAGYHERGEEKPSESLWGGTCTDRRSEGNDRGH